MPIPAKTGPNLTRRIPPRSEAVADADATIKEFCAEVRCCPSYAWSLINAGDVVAYKVGARVKVTRASIEALKERNRIKPKGIPA